VVEILEGKLIVIEWSWLDQAATKHSFAFDQQGCFCLRHLLNLLVFICFGLHFIFVFVLLEQGLDQVYYGKLSRGGCNGGNEKG